MHTTKTHRTSLALVLSMSTFGAGIFCRSLQPALVMAGLHPAGHMHVWQCMLMCMLWHLMQAMYDAYGEMAVGATGPRRPLRLQVFLFDAEEEPWEADLTHEEHADAQSFFSRDSDSSECVLLFTACSNQSVARHHKTCMCRRCCLKNTMQL